MTELQLRTFLPETASMGGVTKRGPHAPYTRKEQNHEAR
nr:MAG TPA: hypothetical protein [Caudoviricetes sp.]